MSGTVVKVNSDLIDFPERVNEEPDGAGWLCEMRPDIADALDSLMDAATYRTTGIAAPVWPLDDGARSPARPDEDSSPAVGTTVCITHAPEDEPVATRIAERLRGHAIDSWMDNLRGGEDWEDHVNERMSKGDVDYVVVLNSRSLVEARVGSHGNSAIRAALSLWRKFVTPVVIDDSPRDSPLDRLRAIDMTAGHEDEGLRELVMTIRKWERVG